MTPAFPDSGKIAIASFRQEILVIFFFLIFLRAVYRRKQTQGQNLAKTGGPFVTNGRDIIRRARHRAFQTPRPTRELE